MRSVFPFSIFHFPSQRSCLVSFALLFAGSAFLRGADDYKLGDDSMAHEGVPQGEVTKHKWESKIFPGTVRDYWVYVPKQYDGAKPACLMVFQDGGNYQNTNGQFRVPTVF